VTKNGDVPSGVAGGVTIRPYALGYLSDEELAELATSLQDEGFQTTIVESPLPDVHFSMNVKVLHILLDTLSEHGIDAIVGGVVTWASVWLKRWRKGNWDKPYFVTIFGPDGKPLKRVEIANRDGEAEARTEDRPHDEEARAWNDYDKL
jgi:hypothetical protein